MTKVTLTEAGVVADPLLFDEDGVRSRMRGFIEMMLEEQLSVALSPLLPPRFFAFCLTR
jgi:hypothetical protein